MAGKHSKTINILDFNIDCSWKIYSDDKVIAGNDIAELKKYFLSLPAKQIHTIFDYNLSRDILFLKDEMEFTNLSINAAHKGNIHRCVFNENIDIRNLKSLIELPLKELKKAFNEEDDIEVMRMAIKEELSGAYLFSFYYLPLTCSGWVKKRLESLKKEERNTKKYDLIKLYNRLSLNEKVKPIYTALGKKGLVGAAPGIKGTLYENCVYSYDIKSSYPYQMCNAEYPLTGGVLITNCSMEEFEKFSEQLGFLYCIQVKLKNIQLKPQSFDWLERKRDNLYTFLTPEFEMLKDAYTFEIEEIPNLVIHLKKGKLPENLRDLIKQMFQEKEESRGNPYLYEKKKKQVNSIFGYFCQDEDLTQTHQRPSIIGYWTLAWAKRELYNLAKISPKHVLYWDTDSIKTTKRLTDEIEIINSNREGKMGIWVEEFAEVDFCCYGEKAYMIDNQPKIAGLPKSAIPEDTVFDGRPLVFKNAVPKIDNKQLVYLDYTLTPKFI